MEFDNLGIEFGNFAICDAVPLHGLAVVHWVLDLSLMVSLRVQEGWVIT